MARDSEPFSTTDLDGSTPRGVQANNSIQPEANVLLSSAQARFLRGQAHDLKAMLQVGEKGITPALISEVSAALEHHELIKLKVAGADRDQRDAMIAELATQTGATLVQRIGHVAVLYRPSRDKRRIVLPRA